MFSILSDAVAMASDAASDIFSSSCDITIALDPPPGRPTAEVKYGATRSICSVYTKGDDITGTVTVQLKQGRCVRAHLFQRDQMNPTPIELPQPHVMETLEVLEIAPGSMLGHSNA